MSNQDTRNKIIHPSLCRYKNEIDFVDKLISIYSITSKKSDEQIRKFEKDVLIYYMRFGYSSDTKKKISIALKKSLETITQATFFLKEKGYLVDSKSNFSRKELCKDLQEMKDNFLDGDKKILAIGFKRK